MRQRDEKLPLSKLNDFGPADCEDHTLRCELSIFSTDMPGGVKCGDGLDKEVGFPEKREKGYQAGCPEAAVQTELQIEFGENVGQNIHCNWKFL